MPESRPADARVLRGQVWLDCLLKHPDLKDGELARWGTGSKSSHKSGIGYKWIARKHSASFGSARLLARKLPSSDWPFRVPLFELLNAKKRITKVGLARLLTRISSSEEVGVPSDTIDFVAALSKELLEFRFLQLDGKLTAVAHLANAANLVVCSSAPDWVKKHRADFYSLIEQLSLLCHFSKDLIVFPWSSSSTAHTARIRVGAREIAAMFGVEDAQVEIIPIPPERD